MEWPSTTLWKMDLTVRHVICRLHFIFPGLFLGLRSSVDGVLGLLCEAICGVFGVGALSILE